MSGNSQIRTWHYYSIKSYNSCPSFCLYPPSNLPIILSKERSCDWTCRRHWSTWQVDFYHCKLCKWPSCFLHLEHLVNVFCLSWLSVPGLEHDEVSDTCHKAEGGLETGPRGISWKHLGRLFLKSQPAVLSWWPLWRWGPHIWETSYLSYWNHLQTELFFSANKYELSSLLLYWINKWNESLSLHPTPYNLKLKGHLVVPQGHSCLQGRIKDLLPEKSMGRVGE